MIVALDNHRKVIESFNLTPFGCIVGESVAGIRQHFSRVISRFICFGDDGVIKWSRRFSDSSGLSRRPVTCVRSAAFIRYLIIPERLSGRQSSPLVIVGRKSFAAWRQRRSICCDNEERRPYFGETS